LVTKRVKYSPIGDSISPESSLVQAAIALDVAAQFAVDTRDTAQMNTTAGLWIELAKTLLGIEEDEEGPQTEGRTPLGFMITTDKENDDGTNPKGTDGSPSEGTGGDDD
jgi:hypothetical protein